MFQADPSKTMGDVIYVGKYATVDPTSGSNHIQKIFDDEFGTNEFEYFDLLNPQDSLHAQLDY